MLHYMLNHTCWKRHLPYWHNYYTPKLKRPKPLRKVFEKSTISRQNYPPNSNGADPCEKAHLSLGGCNSCVQYGNNFTPFPKIAISFFFFFWGGGVEILDLFFKFCFFRHNIKTVVFLGQVGTLGGFFGNFLPIPDTIKLLNFQKSPNFEIFRQI